MTNRRRFLMTSVGVGVVGLRPGISAPRDDRTLPESLVLDFVRGAHTNLKHTQTLLKQEPLLIRVAWEWGPGDFETAIDAAAHTGSLDIVQYLLDHGASYTIFAAAVRGEIDIMRSILEVQPSLVHCTGPHGIPLIDHAIAGGASATVVVEYLRELGAKPAAGPLDLAIPVETAKQIVGSYRINAEGRTLEFTVQQDGQRLRLVAAGRPPVRLLYQGQNRYALQGTPAELIFEMHEAELCQRVLLKEGYPIGTAIRVQ